MPTAAQRRRRRRRRQGSPSYRRARRDVMMSYRPYRRELAAARREGTRDFRQANRRVGAVYGGLANELAPLSGQYAEQMAGIRGNLTSDLGGFADMLGSTVPGVPQGEIAAGTNLYGTIGSGGLEQLASQQARNVGYNTSTQRQGALEKMTAKRNYGQDLTEFLSDLRRQRMDAARDIPALIRQRMDELSERGFDRSMALREFGLRSRAAGLDNRLAQMGLNSSQQLANVLANATPQQLVQMFRNG
jgi:hypothetical protein